MPDELYAEEILEIHDRTYVEKSPEDAKIAENMTELIEGIKFQNTVF